MKTEIALLIGRNLRTVRKARGISLREAAEKSGISAVAIGSYERADRRITADRLVEMAQLYNVPAQMLISKKLEKATTWRWNEENET